MDTPRSLPVLLTLFPNNTAGLITPQRIRDLVVSGPIRSPADWLYQVGAGATAGKLTWDGSGELRINVVDFDAIDRSSAFDQAIGAGAVVRLIDTTDGTYMLQQVITASVSSGVWTVLVVPLLGTFGLTVGDLVAVELSRPDLALGAGAIYQATNAEASTLEAGMAVAMDTSAGGLLLATAAAPARSADGLVRGPIASGFTGQLQTDGILLLTDWTAATGSASLTPGAYYLLSDTVPGQMVNVRPDTDGNIAQMLGRALDPFRLRLIPSPPVLL